MRDNNCEYLISYPKTTKNKNKHKIQIIQVFLGDSCFQFLILKISLFLKQIMAASVRKNQVNIILTRKNIILF